MEQESSTPPPENNPGNEAAPQQEVTESVAVSKDSRTMALLAHILGIFSSFLVPLIIWLIKKEEDAFVEDQAKEALNFQITIMIGWFVAVVLSFVAIGFLLFPVLMVGNLVLGIIAGMKANDGIAYRYPFTIRLIK